MTSDSIKAQAFPIVFDQGIVDVVNLMMSALDNDSEPAVKARWIRSLNHHKITDDWFRFVYEFDKRVHDHGMCPDPNCKGPLPKEWKSQSPETLAQKRIDRTRLQIRRVYDELPIQDRRTTMLADYVLECMEQGLLPSNASNKQVAEQMQRDLLEIKNTA